MAKKVLLYAAAFGAASVVLGALSAHLLEPHLSGKNMSAFKTGVLYMFLHSIVLIALVVLNFNQEQLKLRKVYNSFIGGIFLFSGSLVLLAIRELINMDFLAKLGMITPIGGLLFIAGWVLLFVEVKRNLITT